VVARHGEDQFPLQIKRQAPLDSGQPRRHGFQSAKRTSGTDLRGQSLPSFLFPIFVSRLDSGNQTIEFLHDVSSQNKKSLKPLPEV
jgi:hypothetical protein